VCITTNIPGLEDVVHEIATCGPNFKQVTNALWPFKLSNPNGGWRPRKFISYIEGGDTGNREKNMSKLVHQMV
jgi:large subunit ribosomal protein L7e